MHSGSVNYRLHALIMRARCLQSPDSGLVDWTGGLLNSVKVLRMTNDV